MKYDWKDAGEEWSERWGTSAAQWSGTIFPRIRPYLPAGTILEIGPGYGRWTHYLKDHCQHLIVVDRAPECIEACRARFADDPRVTAHVNEGGSLSMIPDRSVDFIFSFDVFVHIKREVVETYLTEFARILNVGGRGFIHHSNLAAFASSSRHKLPEILKKLFIKWHLLDDDHHRTATMSAELFRQLCWKNGLQCVRQELVNWRGRRLIDCLSWIERSDNTRDMKTTEIISNPNFMREAETIRKQAQQEKTATDAHQ